MPPLPAALGQGWGAFEDQRKGFQRKGRLELVYTGTMHSPHRNLGPKYTANLGLKFITQMGVSGGHLALGETPQNKALPPGHGSHPLLRIKAGRQFQV